MDGVDLRVPRPDDGTCSPADGIGDLPACTLQRQDPVSLVVVFELVPHGENDHLTLVLDLEHRDVARSTERDDQFAEERALSGALRHVKGDVISVAMPDRSAAIAWAGKAGSPPSRFSSRSGRKAKSRSRSAWASRVSRTWNVTRPFSPGANARRRACVAVRRSPHRHRRSHPFAVQRRASEARER